MMNLLYQGLYSCLMSLNIHESDIVYITISLFDIQIEDLGQNQYIILIDRIVFKVPKLGSSIDNTRGEAVMKVLGPDIFKVMNLSNLHQQEVIEGQYRTKYILIYFTRDRAVIDLYLNTVLSTKIG